MKKTKTKLHRGNVSFCPTKGWRARLIMPNGERKMTYHRTPMVAGMILEGYREEAKRMLAKMEKKS